MKKILTTCIILIASCLMTGCSFLDDWDLEGNQQENSETKNIYDYLTSKTYKCDDWTYFDSYFSDYFVVRSNSEKDIAVKLKLQSKSPFGNVEYNDLHVSMTVHWYRKGVSNSKTEYSEWPRKEDGTLVRESYFENSWSSSANKPSTYSVSGTVKYNMYCYEDEFGYLYTKVGTNSSSSSYIEPNWNFVGITFNPNNKTVKMPTDIAGFTIDRFGFCTFDFIGFEDVENIIVPSNYKYCCWNNWKSAGNIKNIYFENSANDIWMITGSIGRYAGTEIEDYSGPFIYNYSETEPQTNPERYWRYVNNEPTPWSTVQADNQY